MTKRVCDRLFYVWMAAIARHEREWERLTELARRFRLLREAARKKRGTDG
jgi:ferric-dicitrate binding protein FerR (iron transport regulator)